MEIQHLYVIGNLSGFTPQIARLISMMNYIRHTTLNAVKGIEINELDYLNSPSGNSIGSLLLHIAATEIGYQAATFHKRDLNEAEKEEWGSVFRLGEETRHKIKGHDLAFYVKKLEAVRTKTLTTFASLDDTWLDEESAFGTNRINNYFKWFHVITHEANHKGQITMLRRLAKQG